MTDTGFGGVRLHPTWHSLARRSAVAAGALTALVSLFEHAPVWVASLRGAAAYFAVALAARYGLAALEQALSADAERAEEREP